MVSEKKISRIREFKIAYIAKIKEDNGIELNKKEKEVLNIIRGKNENIRN